MSKTKQKVSVQAARAKRREELLLAVDMLRGYDHAFISEPGCHQIAGEFGVKAEPYLHHAEPDHPKGLTFRDGSSAHVGLGAEQLAAQICHALGVEYAPMFGRGSQLRACCDALEKWAKAQ